MVESMKPIQNPEKVDFVASRWLKMLEKKVLELSFGIQNTQKTLKEMVLTSPNCAWRVDLFLWTARLKEWGFMSQSANSCFQLRKFWKIKPDMKRQRNKEQSVGDWTLFDTIVQPVMWNRCKCTTELFVNFPSESSCMWQTLEFTGLWPRLPKFS